MTLIYVFGSAIIGQTVLGFALAWMLRGARPAVRAVVETLVLFAWLLPSSVISFLWIAMLDRRNGTLNVLLDSPGFNWLIQYPLLLIIVFNIWRGTAFSMMLFSAALQSVPPSQLESAKMAGANGAQQFRDVVFPHIRGHILTNTLLISLWTFNDFGPYLLTAGGPEPPHRDPAGVHLQRGAQGRATRLRGGDLADHAGDQPDHRAGLSVAAEEEEGHVSITAPPADIAIPVAGPSSAMVARSFIGRVLFYVLMAVVTVFFALPMLWLVLAPFDATPRLTIKIPLFTLDNFRILFDNPYAMRSLLNAVILALGTMIIVLVVGALASYALSRVRIPGRDALLYALLLLSSIVTGTAAMVPIFLLMTKLNLIDTQLGVVLVMTGGLLPAAIFILKDFMDATPRSYEESAKVFGANPLQILRDVVIPIARPGLATIAVWAMVNAWGNFLVPFILLRDPNKYPAAVVMYTFYTEGGQPQLGLISAFSLLYSIPVVIAYLVVSRRYGFRFHGGIKS